MRLTHQRWTVLSLLPGAEKKIKINSMLKLSCHLINSAAVALPLIAIQ